MRCFKVSCLLLAGALLGSPALGRAGGFVAGTNLGISVLNSTESGGSSEVMVGWPAVANLFGGVQPGLKLGYLSDGGNEIYVNTSWLSLSSNGETTYATANVLNVQHDVRPKATGPFFNVGAGFITIGGGGSSDSRMTLGAGLGLRSPVAAGHGAVRGELRIDYVNDSSSPASFYGIGLQFGFDLLFQ